MGSTTTGGLARRAVLAAAVAALLSGCAVPEKAVQPRAPAAADLAGNFGFPLTFSPSKMDLGADPRQDFRRYAGGRWLDAATIPADSLEISGYNVMAKAVEAQLMDLLQEASRNSAGAPKGSPQQQVGDFYASGMDVERLRAFGIKPIQADLDRLAKIDGPTALAQALARMMLVTGEPVVLAGIVSPMLQDRTRNGIYLGDAGLPLGTDNYLRPEAQPVREAYVRKLTGYLLIAGWTPDAAKATAERALAIETRIARTKLSPVEARDPRKRYASMPYAEARQLLSSVDLDAYFRALGLPTGGEVTLVEPAALRERNAVLAQSSPVETRAYLQLELVRKMAPFLTPAFDGPDAAFDVALYGKDVTPPRDKQITAQVPTVLGHPISQLYVARYLSAQTRRDVEAMVGRIKSEFRARIERNGWLAPETRAEALAKLDRTQISVGYPTKWIDYTPVEVRRDDYAGNAMRINEYSTRRELAKFGKPVERDQFATPRYTLPIVINAAYDSTSNGIEIPAAFLQPPFYDAKADPAVNYCTMGAVIGHELTHGFDSQGRQYDAGGNVRDWWKPDDARRFVGEAAKLARQADAFEILPGLRLNGALEVTENLADVGGVALGYAALQSHLRDTPADNRTIEGFTPPQRCFLAWAQLWADKMNEGAMRQNLPTDGHPPGIYRMAAPAQHEKGFYDAFGIRSGDRMWLDPNDRVAIW